MFCLRNFFYIAPVVLLMTAGTAVAKPAHAAVEEKICDRSCLYDFLDSYLDALKAKNPAKAAFAHDVRFSENNVALEIGDGLWGTISGMGTPDLRFADVQTGNIGFYGVVEESGTKSLFALRLKVQAGRIVEAESLVVRPQDVNVPFLSTQLDDIPLLNEMVPAASRGSRHRMQVVADGYFDTLQLNDGTLYVDFADGCDRRENGFQTTNNPNGAKTYGFTIGLGCAQQFELGTYLYDTRIRDRRMSVIDEERGLIMVGGFIDHEGRLGEYRLTDGKLAQSRYRRPHSFAFLETFKIQDGKIARIEANFIAVPYRMPSPWSSCGHAPWSRNSCGH